MIMGMSPLRVSDSNYLILLSFLVDYTACTATSAERVALLVGDKAPDFSLETLDGSRTVSVRSYQGNRPVVLVFGSYT
jgi:hypothetical protein